MNYVEALGYLDGFVNHERGALDLEKKKTLNLERVWELAGRLGHPQRRFAAVHVAGTKGKGSTCAFCDAMLRAAGLNCGLYTSPHLVDVRERIQWNGAWMPETDFARLLESAQPHLEELRARPSGSRRPTYFEILTHLAFLYFAERRADAAVVEVGIGGRLDATNILEPVVCGIANLSYDHCALLGATLDLIAREKAGIFKPGTPAVSAPQTPEAAAALEDVARRVGAPLEFVGRELQLRVAPAPAAAAGALPKLEAELFIPGEGRHVAARLGLAGRHQAENWAVAVRLAQRLHRRVRARDLPDEAIAAGSSSVVWPGRLELVDPWSGAPRLLLDGAHNLHSLETVLGELQALCPEARPRVAVFACARDKDVGGMLRALAAGCDAVVLTHMGNPRSVAPAEWAERWRAATGRPPPACAPLREALELARGLAAGPRGLVLATGSLYLVGAIQGLLLDRGGASG